MNPIEFAFFVFAYWPVRLWTAAVNLLKREPGWGDIAWLICFVFVVASFPLNIPDLFSIFFAAAMVAGGLAYSKTGGDESFVRGTQIAQAKPAKKNKEQLQIAGVPVAREIEATHFLIAGATGTGKSQIINSMLATLRERGDKVLVVDSGGEAMSRLLSEGDVMLNPLDERSQNWSPACEIASGWDADRLSKSVVPDKEGSDGEWSLYAQGLISAVLQRLDERGELTNERFSYYLTIAKSDEIEALIAGLPSQTLFDAGSARMLSNVRGIIGSYLPSYRYLNPATGSDGFSVRKWAQSDDSGWLWLPYQDSQLASLKGLLSCWLGEVVNASLSGQPNTQDYQKSIWIFCDELASLGRISGLTDGLTKGRKYGLKIVAGIQTISQLRSEYGRDTAQTILANFSNWAVLRAPDSESSEYFSKSFGQLEFTRKETSEGSSSNGSSSNTSIRHITEAAVLASQISGLQPRTGYLRLADQPQTIFPIAVPIAQLPPVSVPAYVPPATSSFLKATS